MQRVDAAKIRRTRRWCVDDELAGRCANERVKRAARQRQLVAALAGFDEADAGVRIDGHLSDGADIETRTRLAVGGEGLTDPRRPMPSSGADAAAPSIRGTPSICATSHVAPGAIGSKR